MSTNEDNGMGSYYRTNYNSILEYDEHGMYYWKNCQGQNLYFIKTSDNQFKAVDTENNEYTLTVNSDSDDSYNYMDFENITISDYNGNTFKFATHNEKGYLVKITDNSNNHNSISINYTNVSDDKYNIGYITDGVGRKYVFTYEDGYLSNLSVVNSNDEPISISTNDGDVPISIDYTYDNGLLTKIEYADGKSVLYDYNDNKLSEITNIDDSIVSFEYETMLSNESYKLSEYSYTKSENVTETVEISDIIENVYSREFTSSNYDMPKILNFDKSFNMTYLKDYSELEYYFNYSENELQYIIQDDGTNKEYIANGEFNEIDDGYTDEEHLKYWDYLITDIGSICWTEMDDEHVDSNLGIDKFCASLSTDSDICKIYQTVTKDDGSSFEKDKSFIIGGSVFNNDSPIAINEYRNLSLAVFDAKKDINDSLIPDECLTVLNFNDTLAGTWQTNKTVFTTLKDTEAFFVYVCYDNMVGEAIFDSITLIDTNSYNLVKATDIIPSNKISYENNDNGSIIEEYQSSLLGKKLGTSYRYNDNLNYLNQTINNGVSTYYNYDSENGLLLSKGNNVDSAKNAQFGYTAMGLLESVKQTVTQIDGTDLNIDTNYAYENDRIKSVTHNGFSYLFNYDTSGRLTSIAQSTNSDSPLVLYNRQNNQINTITYANGGKVSYEYNTLGYITKITFSNLENSNPITYEYTYDNYGNVKTYTDSSNNTIIEIDDGSYKIKENNDSGKLLYSSTKLTRSLFGVNSLTSSNTTDFMGLTNTQTIDTFPLNVVTTNTQFDSVGRTFSTTSSDSKVRVTNTSTYVDNGSKTTNLISSYNSSVVTGTIIKTDKRISREIKYSYTDRGQIEDIYRASLNKVVDNLEDTVTSEGNMKSVLIKHYEYDEAGQVILDINKDSGIAIKYKYDEGGNLILKTIYENANANDTSAFSYNDETKECIFNDKKAKTTTYSYDSQWGDLLTAYNGKEITYDALGNPNHYVGVNIFGNDVSGDMIWDGTRLTSFVDGSTTYLYKYSADGYRTQKIACKTDNHNIWNSCMDYIWEGDTLIGYKTTIYNNDETHTATHEIISTLVYNGTNQVVGINARVKNLSENESTDTFFTLLRDGQGNITDMYTSDENVVFHFSYDAYGNCSVSFSGSAFHSMIQNANKNIDNWKKFVIALMSGLIMALVTAGVIACTQQTYKGYVCDYETGLYYSQNRYYCPSWGRFLNMDDTNMLIQEQGEVFSANLFNYCNNDPVNNVDLSGYAPTSYDTANNILSALNVEQLNTIKVGVVPSKLYGKVNNEMTVFGMSLSTVKNADEKDYWRRVFGVSDFEVGKYGGYNYMNTTVNSENGAATMYSLKPNVSPYNIG